MTKIVKVVARNSAIAREKWSPRARNASSGPYADEEIPSDPSPTQARKAATETRWNTPGASGSLGLPTISRRHRRAPEAGDGALSSGGGDSDRAVTALMVLGPLAASPRKAMATTVPVR